MALHHVVAFTSVTGRDRDNATLTPKENHADSR